MRSALDGGTKAVPIQPPMSPKFTISVAIVCLIATSGVAKPGDEGNNQDKHSKGWMFGFGGKRPGPGADNSKGPGVPPGSYSPGGQPDYMVEPNGMMISPTPGFKNPVYPGITKRTTPKMSSSPDSGNPDGPVPGNADPGSSSGPAANSGFDPGSTQMQDNMPHFGETRPEYERRIHGTEEKSSQIKPRSSYPNYNPPAGTYPYRSGPRYSNPSIAPGTNSPAKEKLLAKARDLDAPQPTAGSNDVHKMQVDFRSAHDRIQRALQQRDYATVNTETSALQQQLEMVKSNSAGLQLGDRINVMSMSHWADEAVSNLSEGASSQEDGKIQMGLQNLEKATDALGTAAPPAATKLRH